MPCRKAKRVRPFAAGGVQFTAFSQPGSQYTNNRETKYGINYGGGIKVKVKDPWGFRLDVRQYNMGKPFNLPNASGRLLMWEFSGSISFLLSSYSRINPCRIPSVTASVRVPAFSLARICATWNFTVCSLMPSFHAMVLFAAPSASMRSTSRSRAVSGVAASAAC